MARASAKNFFKIILFAIFMGSINFYSVFAYVMQSPNYKMQSDSLNTGGGDNQNSANYLFKDTMGEFSSGPSASSNYNLKAGYRQMDETYITISSPGDVSLNPTIPGISGNAGAPASGEAVWTVITDSPAGFNLKVRASTDPAMKLDDTYYFDDYGPVAAGSPDYDWTSPGAGNAEFGFTVEPETASDTVKLFTDNGADSCDTGGFNNLNTCWFDFNGSNDINTIYRPNRTDSDGELEKLKFRVESNAKFLKEGYYDATIIVTVSSN